MGPDQSQYLEARKKDSRVPPLLRGIGRVFVVTDNDSKVAATTEWLNTFGIIVGEASLPIAPRQSSRREPDWTSAIKVSRHKVESLVADLEGEPGPEALVIASDIVVWINGQPRFNLSRQKITDPQDLWVRNCNHNAVPGDKLRLEEADLIATFTQPAAIWWDVAVSVSRKGLRLTAADRFLAETKPLPAQLIRQIFWSDVPGSVGRNTRLPLIDDDRLKPYFTGMVSFPLTLCTDELGNFHDWHENCTSDLVHDLLSVETMRNQAAQAILGGILSSERMAELAKQKPKTNPNGWFMV